MGCGAAATAEPASTQLLANATSTPIDLLIIVIILPFVGCLQRRGLCLINATGARGVTWIRQRRTGSTPVSPLTAVARGRQPQPRGRLGHRLRSRAENSTRRGRRSLLRTPRGGLSPSPRSSSQLPLG